MRHTRHSVFISLLRPNPVHREISVTPRLQSRLAAILMAGASACSLVQAQTPSVPDADNPQPAASVPAAPRYSAAEIEQSFSYIDADRDGSLSRAEAAGFKGVARHFDRADLDSDGLLSRDEFRNAMNKAK